MKRLVAAAALSIAFHTGMLLYRPPSGGVRSAPKNLPAVTVTLEALPAKTVALAPTKPPDMIPLQPPKVAARPPAPKPVRRPPPTRKVLPKVPQPVPPPKLATTIKKAPPRPAPAVAPVTKPAPDGPQDTPPPETGGPVTANLAPPTPPGPAMVISPPHCDDCPQPVYPRLARHRNFQGVVLLEVLVTADGHPREVRLLHSSGHAILDQSAMASVRDWHFHPARRGTEPIEAWRPVQVRFVLE